MSNASRESAFSTGDNETLIWIDESCLYEDRARWERIRIEKENSYAMKNYFVLINDMYVWAQTRLIVNMSFEIGCDM